MTVEPCKPSRFHLNPSKNVSITCPTNFESIFFYSYVTVFDNNNSLYSFTILTSFTTIFIQAYICYKLHTCAGLVGFIEYRH